jgi:TrmH family RNA methyltransferase
VRDELPHKESAVSSLSKARTRLIAHLRRRRQRERERRVLVEGPRAVDTVRRLRAQGGPEGAFDWYVASPRLDQVAPELAAELRAETAEVFWVDDAELDELADTDQPQGVLMVTPEPEAHLGDAVRPGARLLVLDGLQDPGNLGTLVRSAAAFAIDAVIALDATVDPWNPKAVRASAGTSFALPVLSLPWADFEAARTAAGLRLWLADAAGDDVRSRIAAGRDEPAAGWALVLGSEGRGGRAEVRAAADALVAIPMPGRTESLNVGVAGALLLYALTASDPKHSAGS